MANYTMTSAVLANPTVPDHEAAAFLASDEFKYFEKHWMGLLPGNVYKVVSSLLLYIWLNKTTWERREACWPSHATIARACGVSVRTVRRILHQDADDHFTYVYRGAAVGELIGQFVLAVERRRRWSAEHHRALRTSNRYRMAVIMPQVPGAVSTIIYADKLAQVRAKRDAQAAAAEDAHAKQVAVGQYNARPSCPPNSAAKLAAENPRLLPPRPEGIHRSHEGGLGPVAIGKPDPQKPQATNARPDPQPRTNRSDGEQPQSNRIATRDTPAPGGALGQTSAEGAPAVIVTEAPPAVPAAAFLSEGEMRRVQADAVAGQAVEQFAREVMGDSNPRASRAIIITALADAATPLDKLIDALYLGRNRISRFQCAGGHVVNRAAYFITTMRNVAREGRRLAYDFAKKDAAEHVAAVTKTAAPQQYGYLQSDAYRQQPQRPIATPRHDLGLLGVQPDAEPWQPPAARRARAPQRASWR